MGSKKVWNRFLFLCIQHIQNGFLWVQNIHSRFGIGFFVFGIGCLEMGILMLDYISRYVFLLAVIKIPIVYLNFQECSCVVV